MLDQGMIKHLEIYSEVEEKAYRGVIKRYRNETERNIFRINRKKINNLRCP